ncbi:MAG: tape measure protein [Candidatus Sedimenticola sp. (ex Thyasira tokunagai)]
MNDLVLSVKLTGDAGDLNGEVQISRKEFEKLSDTTEKTGKAADRAGKKMDRYGKETREASRESERMNKVQKNLARSLAATVGVFVGGAGIASITSSFIQAAATSENFETRLKVLLGSAEEGARLFDEMAQYAGRVPFEFEAIMASATQLAGIMKGGVNEIVDWMPLIGDLAAASGLSIQQTTEQVSRMLSAGAASADMFRERGILAMLGFQAGASYSAEETRKKLMDEWQKMGSQFRGATEELADDWDGLMSMFGDRWFQFRNMVADAGLFDELKAEASEALDVVNSLAEDGTLQDWAQDTSDTLIFLGSSFDEVVIGITALVAAQKIGAIASGTRIAALRAEYAAQLQATAAARGSAGFMSTGYVAAQTRATAADRARAVSLTAMTGAANLAKGSLAFLGGPAGLIALGATAMVMWATSADEAAASTEDYSLKLAQLEGNLKKVEQAELEGEIRRYETIKKRLANDLGDISFWDVLSGDTGERTKIRLELNQVNAILLTAKRRLQELGVEAGKAGQKTGEQADETGKAADKLKEFINALREEQETLGMSAAALARYKAAKLGGSAADQALAASLAAEIEALHEMDRLLDSYIADEEAITAARKERTEANQALITTLQQEYELSQMGDRERAVEIQLRKLSADATDEQKQSVIEWTETIYDAAKASEVLQKQQEKLAEENRKAMEKIENATSRSLQTAEDAFIDFVHTGKLSFADLITSIMDEMLRLQFQETVSPWLGDIFGSIFSTSSVSSAWDSMPMDFSVFSGDGNVVTPYGPVALQKFGDGGITQGVVNRPTVLNMAGERYKSEAVVPLPDGRAIPVDMQGGGQSIVFSPTTHIDARGADAGMLPKLRQIAREESERSLSQFKREINRGGSAARLVGRRG